MLWYRGHPRDYDAWARGGATGWDWQSMLPYFKRTEDWQGGESALRGAGGPMRIETSQRPHPVAEALLAAAAAIGVPVIDDPNGPDNNGATLSNFTATTGPDGHMRRWSAARGYLEPVMHRANLTVLTGATARRIRMHGLTATGVDVLVDSREIAVHAEVGVVLTAGAIGTPMLLWHSGIGDPDELAAVGLPAVHALRGVGRNYQDHPLLQGMSFRARAPLGPLRDNGGGAMINWESSVAGGAPDLHAFVAQGSQGTPALRAEYDLDDGPAFAVSPGLMGSKSVGSMRLLSSDPDVAPEIQPDFFAEPSDLDALVDGVDAVFDLVDSDAFASISAGPMAPDHRLDVAERRRFIRQSTDTFFHSSGTAAMGTSEQSVVSPQLRVHGIEGLWIADASVIPTLPTSNTLAPVLAIAERAADIIGGRVV
jgi:choline dehydrogenase